MKQKTLIRFGTGSAASAFSLLLAAAPTAPAQSTTTTATAETTIATSFPAEVGHATVKPNPRLTVNYSVVATQPIDSKAVSQKLRFVIEEDGLREVTAASGETMQREGRASRYLTINAGKYKNLGQLKTIVAGVFRRFLAGSLAVGTELGKIGDARYGGEIHFVAAGPDLLRCDYVPDAAKDGGFQFKRRDVESLLALIDGTPARN